MLQDMPNNASSKLLMTIVMFTQSAKEGLRAVTLRSVTVNDSYSCSGYMNDSYLPLLCVHHLGPVAQEGSCLLTLPMDAP
jgi:hypothetical protein